MAVFSVPKQRQASRVNIEEFLGIDLASVPNNVSINRSPSCPNMIRDEVGKVRKRDGITLVKTFSAEGDGAINGVHFLYGATTKKLIHTGTNIYLDGTTPSPLYSTAANHISVSKQMNGKLWILDGTTFLVYDGTTIAVASSIAYIPTTLIARTPTGGGVILEPINLIQPKRTEKFAGTSATTVYQLASASIDAATVTIKKMNVGGTFDDLVEGTDFTVNRTLGQVTFSTAPGVSPVTGEDNVYITYAKTVSGYADRVNKCDVSILYGMNGARDRMFISGNPTLPNYDYYSQINDPTYFGDLNYSVIGQDSSKIINYSIVNDYLVTHKNNAENDNNTNLRKGVLVDNSIVFVSQGSYQTSGALAKYSFANLENEPLYVTTEKNVSAITPSDVLGERFSQERSYYISKALETETDLANAFGYVFERFYFLAVGTNIYILDGTQYAPNKDRPFSHRQYECYLWQAIGAKVLWEEGNELHFGTSDGKIKKFEKGSFNDEGDKIIAFWDTPELDGGSFANKKTFTYVGVRLASAPATGVKIVVRDKGIWNNQSSWDTVVDYTAEATYFDFSKINFDNLSFSTDDTPHTLGSKIKIKNVDKIQFRFMNDVVDEPFGLYKVLLEYTESGKYAK